MPSGNCLTQESFEYFLHWLHFSDTLYTKLLETIIIKVYAYLQTIVPEVSEHDLQRYNPLASCHAPSLQQRGHTKPLAQRSLNR